MATERIDSKKAPAPVGAYPHARKAGDWLYLSGVGPRDKETSKIPGVEQDEEGRVVNADVVAQGHSVFRNIQAILEEAGAEWTDIFDITVFLTNMDRDFQAFNRVYATYFPEHQPCRTTIEVGSLPTPIAVELKVIAYLG